MYYSINESIRGYEVTVFADNGSADEWSITTRSFDEVAEWLASFGLKARKPIVNEMVSEPLTYRPFA
jgi:hypothetical protein